MNKPIYQTVDINNINMYANEYEVVSIYEMKYETTIYADKERVQQSYFGGSSAATIQIPIQQTNYSTMVLMKLKKAAEVLYGDKNAN